MLPIDFPARTSRKFYAGKDGLDEQVKHEGDIDPREACTLQIDGLDAAVRVGRYGPYFKTLGRRETHCVDSRQHRSGQITLNAVADRLIEERRGPQALGCIRKKAL